MHPMVAIVNKHYDAKYRIIGILVVVKLGGLATNQAQKILTEFEFGSGCQAQQRYYAIISGV